MTSSNVLFATPLTDAQEAELVETWESSNGLNRAWTYTRGYYFPRTIEEYEAMDDNEFGITQPQIDEFIDDLRLGRRCNVCATTEGCLDAGRCDDCTIAMRDEV